MSNKYMLIAVTKGLEAVECMEKVLSVYTDNFVQRVDDE